MQRARSDPSRATDTTPARLAIKNLEPAFWEHYVAGLRPATKNVFMPGQNRFLDFYVNYSIINAFLYSYTRNSVTLSHFWKRRDNKELLFSQVHA